MCVCCTRCVAQRACEVLPNTEIHNIYGPTEATIWVSSWHCNGGDFEGVATSPIGPPMANTQLYVLDDKLQPVPVGKRSAICSNLLQGICNLGRVWYCVQVFQGRAAQLGLVCHTPLLSGGEGFAAVHVSCSVSGAAKTQGSSWNAAWVLRNGAPCKNHCHEQYWYLLLH